MEYVDIEFPRRIAMGAERRTSWNTTVVQTISGAESTNQNWSRVRHSFDVSFAVRTESDYQAVVAHFYSVRGRAKKYPFRDILDHVVVASAGMLVDDGDSPSGGYWLIKRYGVSPNHYDRFITRPEIGTVAIFRRRAGVTTTITGSATVNHSTGSVEIDPAQLLSGDVLSWSGRFYVPCRYDTDDLPAMIRDRQPGDDGELLVQCDGIPIVEHKEGPVL